MGEVPKNPIRVLEQAGFEYAETGAKKPEAKDTSIEDQAIEAIRAGSLDEAQKLLDQMKEDTTTLDQRGVNLAKGLEWARTIGERNDKLPAMAEKIGRILGQARVFVNNGDFKLAERLLKLSRVGPDMAIISQKIQAVNQHLQQIPEWKRKITQGEAEKQFHNLKVQFNALNEVHTTLKRAIVESKTAPKEKVKPRRPSQDQPADETDTNLN